jgi:hypothetical protein
MARYVVSVHPRCVVFVHRSSEVFCPSLLLGNHCQKQSVKFFIVELFDRSVEIAWQDMSP